MAFEMKVLQITSATSTGAASYTGAGFQADCGIAIFEKQTADGSGVDYLRSTGFGVSSSNRFALSAVYLDNVAGGTVNMGRAQSNAHFIYGYNTTSASMSAFLVADLDSFDADGLTLDWNTVQASGYKVTFILFGGTDLTNAIIKNHAAPAGTGSTAYTGYGFQPDFAFTMTNTDTSIGPGSSHNSGAQVGFGMGYVAAHKAIASAGDETAGKFHANALKTNFFMAINIVAGTIRMEAPLTSFDSDGLTVNFTTTSSGRQNVVMAMKGGRYKVGVFNQNTGTGDQSITGSGWTPVGSLLISANAVSSTSIGTTNSRQSIGAGTSSSNRFSSWFGSSGDPTVVDHNLDTTKVLKMLTEGTPTLTTSMDYVSNDSDGVTYNVGTADATSREIAYALFTSNAVAAGGAVKDIIGIGMLPFSR